jgi:hypothetical protein
MISSSDSRKVLERFIVNNKDLEELEAKIARFNIFEAIGMVRQEIKHSNFIHFLLNPSEKHQLRDLFLKKLLTSVFLDAEDVPLDPLEIAISNFNDAEVRREWKNIDLLIYSPSNRLVCTIENKVDSSEGFNQLKKYEEVIEREFSDCQKVFIFLTKEGDSASKAGWLSLSYSTLADVTEVICDERKSSIHADIYVSMRHYIDLLRRHIVSQSDIAELCRKIYKQHRQAIDLIYEHRPDLRSDIEEFLGQLIEQSSQDKNIEKDDSNQRHIRFVPKEWDIFPFQKTCQGWTSSQRMVMLDFVNEPQSLRLVIGIGPGNIRVRQALYDKLQKLKISGLRQCKIKEAKWCIPCIVQVLTPSDYEDGSLEDLQEKIKIFWTNYANGDLKVIREEISKSFEQTVDLVDLS